MIGLLLLATGLGLFAVWFQWGQTRRCLEFLGPVAAGRIQEAPIVELWSLAPADGRLRGVDRVDISRAPGLVHLRRGLVEDVNYRWPAAGSSGQGASEPRLPAAAWDVALAFRDDADASAAAILAFDLDGPGAMTLVGHAGRVELGRLGPGLRRWIETTKAGFSSGKSGY
ncbi:MAG: hypothetical protein ACKOCX_12980 [Planctomycetota bacterium]